MSALSQGTADWSERAAFVALDWASDHHDVVVVDGRGMIVEELRFEDTDEGWQLFHKRLSPHPNPAVAIETASGATVEPLLAAGYAVYPINPKAAKRYRELKATSGTKTDRIEAGCLGDDLRLDWHIRRTLKPDDPLTGELRLLCRDEIGLIRQRTALVCQLRAALGE